MKIVMWRMTDDCLHTSFQLQRRHIPAGDLCVSVGNLNEWNTFFPFCPFARSVWNWMKESFPMKLHRKSLSNVRQWIFELLEQECTLLATVVAVVAILASMAQPINAKSNNS
jgi:hypothetical protein